MTGYRIDQDTLQWTMIGKGDPQKPQMFYPVRRPLTIRQGDWVAARCTMYNFLDETVNIGSTGNDEMCNFYIMYYVNRMDRILDRKVIMVFRFFLGDGFLPFLTLFLFRSASPLVRRTTTGSST